MALNAPNGAVQKVLPFLVQTLQAAAQFLEVQEEVLAEALVVAVAIIMVGKEDLAENIRLAAVLQEAQVADQGQMDQMHRLPRNHIADKAVAEVLLVRLEVRLLVLAEMEESVLAEEEAERMRTDLLRLVLAELVASVVVEKLEFIVGKNIYYGYTTSERSRSSYYD